MWSQKIWNTVTYITRDTKYTATHLLSVWKSQNKLFKDDNVEKKNELSAAATISCCVKFKKVLSKWSKNDCNQCKLK